jgi:ATP-dependent RNA helicase RhlE
MSFAPLGLDAKILQAVKEAGYAEPTPIQTAAIPPIIAGHDLIGIAQTGTGKTSSPRPANWWCRSRKMCARTRSTCI